MSSGRGMGGYETHLPVTFVDADVADSKLEVEFVQLDRRLYVSGSRMVTQMARRRTGATLVYSHYGEEVLNEITIIDDTQPELLATLSNQFLEKYGHSDEVFISLAPISEDNLNTLRLTRKW
jgi:hypothetical protein